VEETKANKGEYTSLNNLYTLMLAPCTTNCAGCAEYQQNTILEENKR